MGPAKKPIAIALQGGGSLGAYSWGVLDALLECGHFTIEGVSGASAGGLNAALLADGFVRGDATGARALLREFWMELASACANRRRSHRRVIGRIVRSLLGGESTRIVHHLAAHAMANFELEPATMEPLRGTLDGVLNPANVEAAPFRVFVNATAVRTLELRIFSGSEVSTDVLCASSCIPLLFEPVMVDGEPYWDGGFLGNPALYPVIESCETADLLLIQTASTEQSPPESAAALLSRITQAGFAAALQRELRAVDFVSRIVRDAECPIRSDLREMRLHVVPVHPKLGRTAHGRSFEASREFFLELHSLGRSAAAEWLRASSGKVGNEATFAPDPGGRVP